MAAMTIEKPEVILDLIDHQIELSEMLRNFMYYVDNVDDVDDEIELIKKKLEISKKMLELHETIDKVIKLIEIIE